MTWHVEGWNPVEVLHALDSAKRSLIECSCTPQAYQSCAQLIERLKPKIDRKSVTLILGATRFDAQLELPPEHCKGCELIEVAERLAELPGFVRTDCADALKRMISTLQVQYGTLVHYGFRCICECDEIEPAVKNYASNLNEGLELLEAAVEQGHHEIAHSQQALMICTQIEVFVRRYYTQLDENGVAFFESVFSEINRYRAVQGKF